MEFEKYLEIKVKQVVNSEKRRGPRRDTRLLVDILIALLESSNSDADDLWAKLRIKHKSLGKHKLVDNLRYLSTNPNIIVFLDELFKTEEIEILENMVEENFKRTEFIEISSDCDTNEGTLGYIRKKRGRPKNKYKLNAFYIWDYNEQARSWNGGMTMVRPGEGRMPEFRS